MADGQSARTHSVGLDALRGTAALAVVLGHSRELMSGTSASARARVPSPGAATKSIHEATLLALTMPTSFAREAVGVFFALSGYWVGGSVLRSAVRRGPFPWRGYLTARLTRLWIVLLPALVLTAILGWLVVRRHGLHAPTSGASNAGAFVGNLFFLQERWMPSYGDNVSLWSLSYELGFYLAFPLLILGLFRLRRRLLTGFFYLAVAAGVVAVMQPDFLLASVPWVGGAMVGYFGGRLDLSDHRRTLAAAVLILLAGLGISNIANLDGAPQLAFVGLISLPIIWQLGSPADPAARWLVLRRVAGVGPWSYSLYAVHAPIVILIYGLVRPTPRASFSTLGLIYATAIGCCLAAYVFSYLTERHTDTVRRWAAGGSSPISARAVRETIRRRAT